LPLKENAVTDGTAATDTLDASLPAWKRLLINVWQEFKGMFTITRTGDNAGATLLPDEKYFLYQNLRLQLEAARLAVLRRDTSSLHESLSVVRSWLEEYFDLRDTSVMNIIQATEKMRSLELSPVLPEVGTSLEALRDYMDNSGATDQEAESNIQ
jgi:uroporphyrin-3 C-methyltransferase